MLSQRWKEISLLLLTMVLAVLLLLNSQRYFTRIDLTEDKLYSISEVSKKVMKELPGQVSITYYASDKLDRVSQTPQLIEDLLYEYATYAGGNIKIAVVDPDRAGLSEEVQKLGIQPRQIQLVEENEQTYAKVFSGISLRYSDRQEVLPVVFSTESLEYQLTSSIKKMLRQDARRIGILVGDSSMNLQNDYSALYETLSGSFEVEELTRGEMIPERIDILFLLGGEDLRRYDLLHIDQFLINGGNAFFGIGGIDIDLENNLKASRYEHLPVFELLEYYGVRVEKQLVLDRYAKNFRVPRQTFDGINWEVIDTYPHWVSIRQGNVDKEHPITARFQGLDLLWPSPLTILDSAGGNSRGLVESSPEAWLMEDMFITDPYRAGSLNRRTAEAAGQYTLGIALEKELHSFYASQSITPPPGEMLPYDEIKARGESSSRVVLFGSSHFASNLIQYSDSMYNLNFLLNSADWLAHEDDLIKIRSRTVGDTRLNRLDPERARIQYAFSQIVNILLIPLLVVGYGLLRYTVRRRQRGVLQEGDYEL
ncbi:MAG: GldG family protein [Spirochaetaceae bacterium]|nr:GldG family protein [Spirochaetaceae bacterium]MCF7948897.1 GldG family protein [Spirochaetia bacterium]MCF7951298.1 GldG family protein [Spirochaetaceae bacterium]